MATGIERITGVAELDDALSYLREKTGKRIGKKAVAAMSRVLARGIRPMIPKTIAPQDRLKGIGNRMMKLTGTGVMAKAGVGVGAAAKEAFRVVQRGGAKSAAKKSIRYGKDDSTRAVNGKKFRRFVRAGRRGVGISARNLHWFALGTKDRFTGATSHTNRKGPRKIRQTGKARRYTGRINKALWGGFVPRGVQAMRATAIAEAAKIVNRDMAAEVAAARNGGGATGVQVEFDL